MIIALQEVHEMRADERNLKKIVLKENYHECSENRSEDRRTKTLTEENGEEKSWYVRLAPV